MPWIDELAAFNLVIEYRCGSKNPADGLSKRPNHRPKKGEATELRAFSDFVPIIGVPG
jgi:hypothetical protein